MKINNLPSSFKHFIEEGNSVFRCEDGDWNIKIELVTENPWEKHIPTDALIIANNGCGDYLFIRKANSEQSSYLPAVFVFWHEEQHCEIFSNDIDDMTNPEPPIPSDCKKIHYHGGVIDVRLGDEVSARDLLIRKKGRVIYVPGVSKKNSNMEHHGLCWVGIQFQSGSFAGAFVDPESFQVKKSVRFLCRSSETFTELGPDEEFD